MTTANERVIWVSTSTQTRGGVATCVRMLGDSHLSKRWRVEHIATHRDGSVAARILIFLRALVAYVAAMLLRRPVLVHVHHSADGSFVRKLVIMAIAHALRVPVVEHLHAGHFVQFYEGLPGPLRAVVRWVLRTSKAVVVLTEHWADAIRDIEPVARVVVIPNAVPAAAPVEQPATDEPVHVVFIGRIGPRKGAFTLLDAWAKVVADTHRQARLTMVGDGAVERARRMVAALQLDESVDVHGWMAADSVAELLSTAHVLTLPSCSEGQPMAILEAMARGICVVSTGVGGIPETVGDGGLLVPGQDADALASTLRAVIEDNDLRIRLSRNALIRFSAEYDVEVVWRRIDDLYRELVR